MLKRRLIIHVLIILTLPGEMFACSYKLLPLPIFPSRAPLIDLSVIKRIAAKRTAARIAAFEPAKQTAAVEHVATSPAPFVGQLPIRSDHAVADRALRLPLESRCHILPPRLQADDQRALIAADVYDALRRHKPTAPFLLVDGYPMHRVDGRARKRVRGREANNNLHELLVNRHAGGDFARGGRDSDGERFVGRGLRGGPFANSGEF